MEDCIPEERHDVINPKPGDKNEIVQNWDITVRLHKSNASELLHVKSANHKIVLTDHQNHVLVALADPLDP